MPADIQQLIGRLRTETFCRVHLRTTPLELEAGLKLPPDVEEFFRAFAGGDLFSVRRPDGMVADGPNDPINGWELYSEPFRQNANALYQATQLRSSLQAHYNRCYILGCDSLTQTDALCLDLNPEQFGWVFVHHGESVPTLLGVDNAPVVAKSFAEWLERTLDFGPKSDLEDEGLEKATYTDVADDITHPASCQRTPTDTGQAHQPNHALQPTAGADGALS